MRRIGNWLLVCGLAAAVLVATGCGSEQVKRAKEYLGVRDFGTAATELKVELRKHPDNREAAALLLYAQTLQDGPAGVLRYQGNCLVAGAIIEASGETTSTVESSKVAESKMELRKDLLDLGIETKDWASAKAILERATEYGFSTEELQSLKVGELEERGAKAAFAGCLAWLGDPRGLEYLTTHLRDEWGPEQTALLLLGPAAQAGLQGVAASPEHLSRDAAKQLLQALELGLQVQEFVAQRGPLSSLEHHLRTVLAKEKERWEPNGAAPCFSREFVADGEIALDATVQRMVGSRTDLVLERSKKKEESVIDSASYAMGDAKLVVLAGRAEAGEGRPVVRLLRHRDGNWRQLPIDDFNDRTTGGSIFAGLCTSETMGESERDILGDRPLGEDQILVRYYDGVEEVWRTKKTWYGPEKYKTSAPKWSWAVYHVGSESVQFVRDPVGGAATEKVE